MDRANVTSGAAFKTAVRGTLILAAIFVLASIVAYFYVQRQMLGVLEDQIVEDQIVLAQIYQEGGVEALAEVIDTLRHPLGMKYRVIGLFDARGRKLAGNIDLAPDLVGWSSTALTVDTAIVAAGRAAVNYHVNRSTIGSFMLVVGRDQSLVEVQLRRMLTALVLMGVVISAAFLWLGYRASLHSLRKLGRMADTLDLVSKGDAGARLDVSDQNDQIDRVSRAMNLHLDRLSTLMATTRASAAAIAHDLRTPLSRAFLAVSRAQALQDKGEDARDALDEVAAELTRLRSIFDAILRISRLEQDRGSVDVAVVPLAPLLADLAETFAPLAEDKGQTLTLLPVAADVTVLGDSAMLAQLVANLTQNAISHGPAGTAITLGAAATGGTVRLWVADTGPGIPEAEREKVFDLFYRADPNRTGGGNGLGMALVKAIADHLGGRITLSDAKPGLRVDVAFEDHSATPNRPKP
jgi:signal transduction histidine kinase